jgi:hypothetical protein
MLPPVVTAFIAFIATLFRANSALRLENLALRYQLAVYKQTVHRPRLRPTDRLFWSWLSRLWPGWQSVADNPRGVKIRENAPISHRLRGRCHGVASSFLPGGAHRIRVPPWKRRAAPGAGGMRGARGGHEQAKRVQAGPATLV